MLNFSFNFNCTSGSRAVVIYSQAIANEIYFDEVVVWAVLGHRRVVALSSPENNPFANVIQCTGYSATFKESLTAHCDSIHRSDDMKNDTLLSARTHLFAKRNRCRQVETVRGVYARRA